MNYFNWLHLTDLHHGHPNQATLWPTVRNGFFDDLELMYERSGPWHAVFFTGDFVQSGQKDEFVTLQDKVLGPLKNKLEELGSQETVLLCVPGNHDLLRPDDKKPSAALRQLLREGGFAEVAHEFWSDSNCEYRELITKAFEGYQSWQNIHGWRKPSAYSSGILPGDFAATIETQGDEGILRKVGIAGVNTTFLQLAGGNFLKRLAWDLKQLHIACGEDIPAWEKCHDARILLTHQGPEWLDENSVDVVYPEINPAGRFAVHLFGHMHKTVFRSLGSGGGKVLRQWQGNSLFGLEKFGYPPIEERRHGYGIGRIQFDADRSYLNFWPRKATKDSNGWRFIPDHDACVLADGDSTVPTSLNDVNANSTLMLAATRSVHGRTYRKKSVNTSSLNELQWPANNDGLREYCLAVSVAHSQIKFVEAPLQKDMSPVQLDYLYVEPNLSQEEINADTHPTRWPKTTLAAQILKNNPQAVILGDPGSGKSTLVSCLSWQLCRPTPVLDNDWTIYFGGFLPIPIILRELSLKVDVTWDILIDSFLRHHIGKLLPGRAFLDRLLKSGKVIVLLDGLDEIGNLTVRRKLRDAVHAGMSSYPNARWIVTSRIIGYDMVPFHLRTETVLLDEVVDAELIVTKNGVNVVSSKAAEIFYLAPFSDQQINTFSNNWYSQHETVHDLIIQSSKDFVAAIGENDGTKRLARIPYLLTLMALIHHKNARLPHGRTELYERIATAYLEQIDLRRRLDRLPYSLSQKKRWLAEIAYRMQLRRSKGGDDTQRNQILASVDAVKKWLKSAMKASSTMTTENEVDDLLDYFAKRSGLLLPRGEGKFAFMHLSLQEYFAACFIEPRLTASRFSARQLEPEPSDAELKDWGNRETWRETFVLLFELVSQKSIAETEGFLKHVFGDRLEQDRFSKEVTAAGLLAEISTDSFVELQAETKQQCIRSCWRWVLQQRLAGARNNSFNVPSNVVVRTLLRETDGDIAMSWRVSAIAEQELDGAEILDISGCSNVASLEPLSRLRNLRILIMRNCTGVIDLTPLLKLKALEILNLDGCTAPINANILSQLTGLLSLFTSQEIDLGILSTFNNLQELHLHYPEAQNLDFSAIAHLSNLDHVCAPALHNEVKISSALRENQDSIKSKGVRRLMQDPKDRRRLRRPILKR